MRGGVVIAVIADVDADSFENGVVVGPCGRRNPYVLRAGVAFDEFRRHAQRACAAQALRGFGAAVGDDFVSRAKQQFLRGFVVGGDAVDAEIVFAVFTGQQTRFGGFDGAENGGLPVGIFVHADAEIDFFGTGFGFEGFA